MATVRIITAMTIDGFLPDAGSSLMRWLMTDVKGFRHWHDIGTYTLGADYPVLDLVCDKAAPTNPAYTPPKCRIWTGWNL